jgi:hypothetical protein
LTPTLAMPVASATPQSGADPVSSATPQPGSDPADDVDEPTNDPAEDPGVVSLANDLGVSTPQAITQMEIQVAAGRAERDLPPGLARVFSGREIQHNVGGRVLLGMTDHSQADAMRAHFTSYGVSDIEIKIVPHAKQALDTMAEGMQRRLRKSRNPRDNISVEVGRQSIGSVTVKFVDGPMNAEERKVVSQARADSDMFDVIEVDHIDAGELDACDRTGNIECDPPLRGSVWMWNTERSTPCTVGFNARSRSDQKPYVLTAGHCHKESAARWYTDLEDESNHFIGPFHNSYDNSTADAGILRVDNPNGWQFGQPWITVNPNGGGHTANDSYVIRDVLDPGLQTSRHTLVIDAEVQRCLTV